MSEQVPTFSVDTGFDGLGYGFENSQSSPESVEATAIRELWCNVILRAILDLQNDNPSHLLEKQQAHTWLFGSGDFFPWVCHMAGVQASVIRGAAVRVLRGELRIITTAGSNPRNKP